MSDNQSKASGKDRERSTPYYQSGGTLSYSPSSEIRKSASQSSSIGKKQSDSSSSSSPTSSTSTSAAAAAAAKAASKAGRARVSMACIHCRQRKIRCDGQHPACSTCQRLGRLCNYESISEIENLMTRERKKRGKEAKQARLQSMATLGIPIQSQEVQQGLHSPMYASSMYGSSASMGAIRDSRAMRQEKQRPYMAGQFSMLSSRLSSDQRFQMLQNPHPQQLQLALAPSPTSYSTSSFASTSQQFPPPPLPHHHHQQQHYLTRKRGTTLDSYYSTNSATPSVLQPDHSLENARDGFVVNSLSQPSTPETTYSMHASMLSYELSRNQSQSPTTTFNRPYYMGSHSVTARQLGGARGDESTASNADSSDSIYRSAAFAPGSEYIAPPLSYQSEGPSTSSRSSAGDVGTLATSISSIAPSSTITSNSPSTTQQQFLPPQSSLTDFDQEMAIRRRSSFDVGNFWRRSSVADAAVANFFDRVIQARGTRKKSFEEFNSPNNRHQSTFATGLPSTSSHSTEQPYPMYTDLREVMQDAVPIDTPYTSLSSNPNSLTFSHPFSSPPPPQRSGEQSHQNIMQRDAYSSASLPLPYEESSRAQYDLSDHAIHHHISAPSSSSSITSSSPQPNVTTSMSPLHLDALPTGFISYRQHHDSSSSSNSTHHTNTASKNPNSAGLASDQYYFSPQDVVGMSSSGGGGGGDSLSAPTSSYHSASQDMFFAQEQQQQQHHLHEARATQFTAPPPLPTPITELSSNMFGMAPPSTESPTLLAASGSPTTVPYYPRPFLSPWSPHQDDLNLQQHHLASVDSRNNSFSSTSIQEEEEEGEEANQQR